VIVSTPNQPLRIGELFAGYGGLGMGVQAVLGGEVVWFSEFDPAPSKILAHHWPDVPNHGDITKIDWLTVEPVDVLTGGFPCQDVSLAGARAGIREGTRSGLWSEFARAIEALQPRLVVIENVRGLLSASAAGPMESDPWGVGDGGARSVVNALGAVLGDLADLGYDAEWCGVRAADAGAPHGRFRVFIVAYPQSVEGRIGYGDDVQTGRGTLGRVEAAGGGDFADTANNRHERSGSARYGRAGLADSGSGAPTADASGERLGEHPGESPAQETRPASSDLAHGAGRSRADSDGRATTPNANDSGRNKQRGGITSVEEHPPPQLRR